MSALMMIIHRMFFFDSGVIHRCRYHHFFEIQKKISLTFYFWIDFRSWFSYISVLHQNYTDNLSGSQESGKLKKMKIFLDRKSVV